MADYYCHTCGRRFTGPVDDTYRTYLFQRCPDCASAKTTLD